MTLGELINKLTTLAEAHPDAVDCYVGFTTMQSEYGIGEAEVLYDTLTIPYTQINSDEQD